MPSSPRLQYCVFMIVYAARPKERTARARTPVLWGRLKPLVLVGFMFLLGAGIWKFFTNWLPNSTILGYTNASLNNALGVLGSAIVGIHYFLDGVLWRLSDRDSRDLAFEKYPFLFRRKSPPAEAVAFTSQVSKSPVAA